MFYASKNKTFLTDDSDDKPMSVSELFRDHKIEIFNASPESNILAMEAVFQPKGELTVAFSVNTIGLYSFEIILQNKPIPGRVLLEVIDTKELVTLKDSELDLSNGFQTKSTFKFSQPIELSESRRYTALIESAKTEKPLEKKKLKPIHQDIGNPVLPKSGKLLVRFSSNQSKRLSNKTDDGSKIDSKIEQLKKVMNKKPGLLESFMKSNSNKLPKDSKFVMKYSKDS